MVDTIDKLGFCRFCQSKDYRVLFNKDGYDIAGCQSCGFYFLDFKASEDFIRGYYAQDFFEDPGIKHGFGNYENEAKNLKITFSQRIETLRKYKPSGTLLDVGCATG